MYLVKYMGGHFLVGGGGDRGGSGIVGWRDRGNSGGLTRSLNFWGSEVEVHQKLFFTLKSGCYFVWFWGIFGLFLGEMGRGRLGLCLSGPEVEVVQKSPIYNY